MRLGKSVDFHYGSPPPIAALSTICASVRRDQMDLTRLDVLWILRFGVRRRIV